MFGNYYNVGIYCVDHLQPEIISVIVSYEISVTAELDGHVLAMVISR